MKPHVILPSKSLSTPHGALGTDGVRDGLTVVRELSTPHGALGTKEEVCHEDSLLLPFNSTRCIRNNGVTFEPNVNEFFQLHTVH